MLKWEISHNRVNIFSKLPQTFDTLYTLQVQLTDKLLLTVNFVFLNIFLLSVCLSYLQKSFHIPDHLSSHRAVLHVVVDPASASMAGGGLCRLLVDNDLKMVTKDTIYKQFIMCYYRLIQFCLEHLNKS